MARPIISSLAFVSDECQEPVNKAKPIKATPIMIVNDSENNICRAKSQQIPDKKNVKPRRAFTDIRNTKISKKSAQPTENKRSLVEDAMYLEKYPPIERCPIDPDKESEYIPTHFNEEERWALSHLSGIFYKTLESSFGPKKVEEIHQMHGTEQLHETKATRYSDWDDSDSLPTHDNTSPVPYVYNLID